MPSNQISLVDFCNNLKVSSVSLKSPLDTVEPLGLTSFGCSPLLSHRATAANAILSEINQSNGADQRDLLTSPSDNTPSQWPAYSAYIAGLRGAHPITATAASPFPGASVTYDFPYTIGGFTAYRDSNPGHPFQFGDLAVGFGINSKPYPSIVLGGQSFDATTLGIHSAFHTYDQQLRIAYCPTAPMTPFYNTSTGFVQSNDQSVPAFRFIFQQSSPAIDIDVPVWECNPALTSFTGTTVSGGILSPNNQYEKTLVGHTRTYGYQDFGNVTMPAYGGNLGVTYPVAPVRPFMVIYCTAGIQNITINGVSGTPFGGDTFTIQIGPPITSLGTNTFWTISQVLSWSLPLDTTTFNVSVTVSGGTFSSSFTYGTPNVPHFFEGLAFSL